MRLFKKSRIPIISLFLAVLFCVGSVAVAVEAVDLTRTGTVTFRLGDGDMAEMGEDMASTSIPVYAWRLAEISQDGSYTAMEAFRSLELEGDGWNTLTQDALALIYGEGGTEEGNRPLIAPSAVGTLEEGLSGLPLGLYLVSVGSAASERYVYSFSPMLLSLPWSEMLLAGAGSDEWQYTLEVMLKPEREPREGNVRIVKTLNSYNASRGDVTFVFEITARDPESGEIIYSNVLSMDFSASGIKEALLEHLPAGAEVTVREVYSGANCTLTISDDEIKAVRADDEISFSFVNEYDGEEKTGYGVENRFRYDTEYETYVWTTSLEEILP